MKNLILWMLLLCSIVSSASAQKVTLTDIALKNFKGVKELKGKGYYACYVDESSSMNGSNFILKFYDYNRKTLDDRRLKEKAIFYLLIFFKDNTLPTE